MARPRSQVTAQRKRRIREKLQRENAQNVDEQENFETDGEGSERKNPDEEEEDCDMTGERSGAGNFNVNEYFTEKEDSEMTREGEGSERSVSDEGEDREMRFVEGEIFDEDKYVNEDEYDDEEKDCEMVPNEDLIQVQFK